MPRIAKVKSEEGEVLKRAPRRTVVKRAPRTTLKRTTQDAPAEVEEATSVRRKAPTRPAMVEESVRPSRQKREKSLYVSGALFGFGLLAAALIGYSDEGQINPTSVIAERNARLTAGVADADGGSASGQVIPVQNTSTEKNGGLVRSTTPVEVITPVTEEANASTTATTTTETASSTDAVNEEGNITTDPAPVSGESISEADQVVFEGEVDPASTAPAE